MMFAKSSLILYVLGTIVTNSEGAYEIDKAVVKTDLPHIGCDVCLKATAQIYVAAEAARLKAPYKKLKEMTIFEIIDNVCTPTNPAGLWMRTYDILEYKDSGRRYLTLQKQEGMSTCGRECGTIEKSCIDLFDEDIDRDELAVLLWQNKLKSLEEFQEIACTKLSKRCKNEGKNRPLQHKTKRVEIPFVVITEKEVELEKMMVGMKSSGMSGQIFSTAELQDMNKGDDDEEAGSRNTINENGDTVINF